MKRKILIAWAAVFAVLFLFSGFMLCRGYLDERKSSEAFDSVAQLVVETPPAPEATPEASPGTEPQVEVTAFEKYAEVSAKNSDFIGWISIDGTRIDYPVMQTKDNPDYYLKRNFEKRYSDYGVPYIAESCDVDISDNTVIYGHHMNNGTMFSDLCKYESKSFYEQHKTIRFDTLGGYGEYEVLAVFKTVAYSESGFKYYRFNTAAGKEQFDEYVSKCKELSFFDTGVHAKYGDKLVTLSTCEYSQTNGRLVVVARKIAE